MQKVAQYIRVPQCSGESSGLHDSGMRIYCAPVRLLALLPTAMIVSKQGHCCTQHCA
jgi:hypothetical protein